MNARPAPLAGKVALVTGASGGIGRMIARGLAISGARVMLTGLTSTKVRRAHDELVVTGFPEDHLISLAADLTDPDKAAAVVNTTLQRFGSLDVLVNAAGVGHFARFDELTLEHITEVIQTNLMTTLHTTHHAIEALKASRGHVINISSGLGKRGARKATAYAAAKFAVQGFSESLRLDVSRFGVRVTVISPAGAGVDTPFWERADPQIKRQGMLQPERIAETVLMVLTSRGNALLDDITVRNG